jgi:uncharacterized protein (UPF0371 family)
MGLEEVKAFDNDLYLDAQLSAFQERLEGVPGSNVIIEFGGKPFGDQHAARVLPGYNPDNKAEIIRGLQHEFNSYTVMVVNARDLLVPPDGRTLHGRIRGDSGLRYYDETTRMIGEARDAHDIRIERVVVANTPKDMDEYNVNLLDRFADNVVEQTGKLPQYCYEIPGYPDVACLEGDKLENAFADNDHIGRVGRSLLLMSPGGGSGKFGIALSEIHRNLDSEVPVGFAKFETFPVFGLDIDHPLNLAFVAATADLGNYLVALKDGKTNYDKDCENFALLAEIVARKPSSAGYLASMVSQTDFSVNVIESGILDDSLVRDASAKEIWARLKRYREECLSGNEKISTVHDAAFVAGQCAVRHLIESDIWQ